MLFAHVKSYHELTADRSQLTANLQPAPNARRRNGEFFMAILRQSAKDLVYEALKEKILKQEYNLGDPLNIVHLSAEFGTSNTPIREALSRLESEGLVTSSLNSKFRVTELTEESSHELDNTIRILQKNDA